MKQNEDTYSNQLFETTEVFELESGKSLKGFHLSYETWGRLNEKKSNVVLICHALTGDSHAADDPQTNASDGWWNLFVGPGKAIDTTRYFVICSNVLGGCKGSAGPASIDPDTNKPYGLNFPIITINDMVNAQKRLIVHLNITRIKLVIGGSMGGMQAQQWAISYPQMVERCAPIASTPQVSPQALAFDIIGRHAILSDSNWYKGDYYDQDSTPETGLSIARMIGHITYLSEESMMMKFGRELQERKDYGYDFETDFKVESYLKYQGQKFVNRFDANSYLYVTKAVDYFDLAKKYGSLEKAFEKVSAAFLVISISSDILYPPSESKKLMNTLIKLKKQVTYAELTTPYGHDAFLLENPQLGNLIQFFLERD